jgi:hypothetical protein
MNCSDAMMAAALSMLPACAAAAGPVGGQFEMFDIAVDGDRVVGRYLEEQGAGPARACTFTFTGTLRPDGRAAVTARGSGGPPATGTLNLKGDELTLALPQVNGFDGCFVPRGEPLSGSRTSTAAWTDLARVTAPRARFRPAPSGKPGARYVVRGDVVGVLRKSGGALLVEYASGEGKPVQGWINGAEARRIGGE